MGMVLQPWVSHLSFMQQSVLLTAIRGADTLPKKHVSKYLLRWYRRCILICAFEKVIHRTPHEPCTGNFTGAIPRDWQLDYLMDSYLQDVDAIPHHFHLHVVHAAEILGYQHYEVQTKVFWSAFYERAVQDMHMRPESKEEMERRLGDKREDWLAAGGQHEAFMVGDND